MSPVPIEPTLFSTMSSSSFLQPPQMALCFDYLRGVRWRIELGVLPSSLTSSVVDIRRATADLRRNYAAIRRQLLIHPHVPMDEKTYPDLVMDNPLSQNPDSMWGRFFRNAELERMVDQDLSRLYPEQGSYFQTSACQAMLRRVLLLWCIGHPEYGYRQGMHELLAPLLYVLQADIEYLSQVRNLYADHFTDNFDAFSAHENDSIYKIDPKVPSKSIGEEEKSGNKTPVKISNLFELDPKIQSIILLNDAYGAEGELGVLLSVKFMEHDAYCLFDALMNGAGGSVAMAEFFSLSPYRTSHTGLPTVIEASAALYHLLSLVDSSLHSHLIELGVEPQYFALRWFRVLFGREFPLEDLLIIWDEIFAFNNTKLEDLAENHAEFGCMVLNSSRGAFISAFAVSMILSLRSSLLATENATACLQRLLSFSEHVNLKNLITKAKSLHSLAMVANKSVPFLSYDGIYQRRKSTAVRPHSHSFDLTSPPLNLLSETYWEEKWRVLHKEEEKKHPSPKSSVRRSLLTDLVDANEQDGVNKVSISTSEEKHLSEKFGSERNSSTFSDLSTPIGDDNLHDMGSERSSVASNFSVGDTSAEASKILLERSSLPQEGLFLKLAKSEGSGCNSTTPSRERKFSFGRFNWVWKFGRNASEGTPEKESSALAVNTQNSYLDPSSATNEFGSVGTSKGESVDHNLFASLKCLGNSMRENIQVIEHVIHQDDSQADSPSDNFSKNVVIGKGQAMAALKELRRISNLLSEV